VGASGYRSWGRKEIEASLWAFGITQNFGSGNLGFENRYPKMYIKFLLLYFLGT
jgi:hypothetical protein